jgi:hypothetical protein
MRGGDQIEINFAPKPKRSVHFLSELRATRELLKELARSGGHIAGLIGKKAPEMKRAFRHATLDIIQSTGLKKIC